MTTSIQLDTLSDLDENDHVKCLGDNEWHTVRELRTGVHQEERPRRSRRRRTA